MNSDRMAVLPGPPQTNEINDLECQPGVTAHTDSKGQYGEVSTPTGWTGRKCPRCTGFGQRMYPDGEEHSCDACGGTGDEYVDAAE